MSELDVNKKNELLDQAKRLSTNIGYLKGALKVAAPADTLALLDGATDNVKEVIKIIRKMKAIDNS